MDITETDANQDKINESRIKIINVPRSLNSSVSSISEFSRTKQKSPYEDVFTERQPESPIRDMSSEMKRNALNVPDAKIQDMPEVPSMKSSTTLLNSEDHV